jgi:TorA maturation chaperone TorD
MRDEAETGLTEGESTLTEEDEARANLYAVLARLWYAAPDRELLDALARSAGLMEDAGDTALAVAWRGLARAAADADPDELTYEYDSLFIGTGSAEITLYCSHYLTETGRERIVVALRDELLGLGLGRTSGTHEPEDHLAALLEVMRHLIVQGSDVTQIGLQKTFFLRYIRSSYAALTDAVIRNGGARFYQDVARLTRAFLDVESQSFDMI